MTDEEELPGVAALADRPVDGRRVAVVMAIVGGILALGSAGLIERLLATADEEGDASRALRAHASPLPQSSDPPGRMAILLVDGMRADEALRLPSWRRLAPHSVVARVELDAPTLSRPFYHLFLTGVPADASGVRSNRFLGRARHDSVVDRVRARSGSVHFVAEGLDWLRRMHGRASDGGSDERSSIEDRELRAHLAHFRSARAPALLVVHVTSVDSTAHHGGIRSPAHRRALARADRVLAAMASDERSALFVLSDHGHRDAGGHGGEEPEVAQIALLARAPALLPSTIRRPFDATRLAATFAAWLGVPAPRSATGAAVLELAPPGYESRPPTLRSLARRARAHERMELESTRNHILPFVLLIALMTLGPIKRAYGFDRSVALAIVLWPALVVGVHRFVLDRPLSYSAIDTRAVHGVRVALIGMGAAMLTLLLARLIARDGSPVARLRRAAASTGWSAFVTAFIASAWIGFRLGPSPLSAGESYVPLLALGAAAPALAILAFVLLASAWLRE